MGFQRSLITPRIVKICDRTATLETIEMHKRPSEQISNHTEGLRPAILDYFGRSPVLLKKNQPG